MVTLEAMAAPVAGKHCSLVAVIAAKHAVAEAARIGGSWVVGCGMVRSPVGSEADNAFTRSENSIRSV